MSPSPSSRSSSTDLLTHPYDIIIIGTGAAGLSAALSAATHSPSSPPKILIIDKAPSSWAGGNGYFTAAAYRTQHDGLSALLPLVSNVDSSLQEKIDLPPYTAEQFRADLSRVTEGRCDATLSRILVEESWETVRWLREVGGVEWELSFRRQAYEVGGRWRFWGGLCLTCGEGGKGLIRGLLGRVQGLRDCGVSFGTEGRRVLMDGEGRVEGVEVVREGRTFVVKARSVVLAAGGFEANPELRERWMGMGWGRAHTRGTPYNTGEMLRFAIEELGAKRVGDYSPTGCHSVAWDADSPRDGGDREKTNEFTKSGYPLGLMLNVEGRRFVDEGVDLRNYTYAKFGRAILEQPEGMAYQIWDDDGQQLLRTEEYRDEIVRKIKAATIEELARKLTDDDGLRNPAEFVQTINDYNSAVAAHRQEHPHVTFNPAVKDGLSTQSSSIQLPLAKSNWALPITKPPFVAVKVTSGITFTFGGLAINAENAAVLREDGTEIEGLHCCGEMVGGLFYGNYPGGSGLTAGGVFGRRAGRAAAERARAQARQAPDSQQV